MTEWTLIENLPRIRRPLVSLSQRIIASELEDEHSTVLAGLWKRGTTRGQAPTRYFPM